MDSSVEVNSNHTVILGAGGQVGSALQALLPKARALSRQDFDMSNFPDYNWEGVSVVINAAGYTAVDAAETIEGRKAAWLINGYAVSKLATAAMQYGFTLVHISTDYVFDGSKQLPYSESDTFAPLSVYGQSKAAGDLVVTIIPRHYLFRTSWVIGEGKNFVRTMLSLAQKGIDPSVVSDQIGRPTLAADLAAGIVFALEHTIPWGTYNLTGAGDPVSWAGLARYVFHVAETQSVVTDITTEKYTEGKLKSARRPLYSVLDLKKIIDAGFTPKDWRQAIGEYIKKELQE